MLGDTFEKKLTRLKIDTLYVTKPGSNILQYLKRLQHFYSKRYKLHRFTGLNYRDNLHICEYMYVIFESKSAAAPLPL